MSTYEEAAAALLDAATPIGAYCQRTPRPNRHADQLDTLLLRVSEFGEAADQLQRGYEGSPRIRDFCARVRARMACMLTPQVPDPLRLLAGALTSHCLPLPAHARRESDPQPL